jgi:sortase A
MERRSASREVSLRRLTLSSGIVLLVVGLGALAWGAVTWQWGDPVTALYTKRAQSRLADELEAKRHTLLATAPATPATAQPSAPTSAAGSEAGARASIGPLARRYRATLGEGDAVGRLRVPRLDLDVVVVLGTEDATLRDGPGIHRTTRLPGQGGLIYVAGHRTTYDAPFADVDRLRAGDVATMELPYGTFRYEVTGTRIVDDDNLSVLAPTDREILRLQACHPRFRATQRIVVSARLVDTVTVDA